ncbi:MAG: hypothetical protein WC364_05810 [Eubacteriales bacterium]|jgi:hypothetical protein
MSLTYFTCPDGSNVEIKQCLTKCRLQRCQTIPYLHLAASEREWTGEGSTTQLLNGTMQSFLKITIPYAIDPDSMAFAIIGTKAHKSLELKAKELEIVSELSATDDGRNAVDLLQYEDGQISLIDTKTWGSFRVAKAMGIIQTGTKPDPSGEVYQRSGKWGAAGSPKRVPVFARVISEAENWEAEMQLNRYRIMIEDKGIPIHNMAIHALVRDGGLMTAKQRGVLRNTYLIPVAKLEDDMVRDYFDAKQEALQSAIKAGKWDTPCNDVESWEGNRCKSFCPVAQFCPKGILLVGHD